MMRLAYADPPYIGKAKKHYGNHVDYAGEVDHAELIERLQLDYDGWALSCSSPSLRELLPLCPPETRVLAWAKQWVAYKKGVGLAYAWEPVLLVPARKRSGPEQGDAPVVRDWLASHPTYGTGLVGAKPEVMLVWLFEALGADRGDELDDLYPGSGAVGRAWDAWCLQLPLAMSSTPAQMAAFAEETSPASERGKRAKETERSAL